MAVVLVLFYFNLKSIIELLDSDYCLIKCPSKNYLIPYFKVKINLFKIIEKFINLSSIVDL